MLEQDEPISSSLIGGAAHNSSDYQLADTMLEEQQQSSSSSYQNSTSSNVAAEQTTITNEKQNNRTCPWGKITVGIILLSIIIFVIVDSLTNKVRRVVFSSHHMLFNSLIPRAHYLHHHDIYVSVYCYWIPNLSRMDRTKHCCWHICIVSFDT